MDGEDRFSIVVLEKDVLEYNYFKTKFKKYEYKLNTFCGKMRKNYNNGRKMFYYNKYIKKMKYLEENYRKTHVYTDYHKQLETPYLNDQTPVVATMIEPSAPYMN